MLALRSRWLTVAYVLVGLLLYIALLSIPITVDYTHYSSSTRAFLAGDSRLYDANTNSYYYMPWGLLVTIPLSYLPDSWGQAGLCFFSFSGVLLSLRLLVDRISIWGMIFVTINLYIFNLIMSAQWDGISVGACGLAWWSVRRKYPFLLGISLLLSTIKPTNMILVLFLLSIYVTKHWQIQYIFKAILIPLIVLIFSLLICGIDWPLRYVQFLRSSPPPEIYNLSLWRNFSWLLFSMAIAISLWFVVFIWQHGITSLTLSLAMVVYLFFSPYLLSYHFVGTSPALGWLTKKHRIYLLIPWSIMIYQLWSIVDISREVNYLLYPLSIGLVSMVAWFRTE